MANVHLIIGEDDYLVAEAAKKIVGDGVGLEVVDSIQSTNAELQLADLRRVSASFATPPFLDPRKVTWWKNVHFLPHQGGKAVAQDVAAALETFAKKASKAVADENQQLLITGPKLLKTSTFAKTMATFAEVAVFSKGKPWEEARNALQRAQEFASQMGLEFAPGAAERFAQRVGSDTRSLLSELGKMRDYLGDGARTIAAADVEAITSQGVGVEPMVWEVTDALGARDVAKTVAAARQFEGSGGFAVLMTSVVERFFRQLVDLKNGVGGDELAAFTRRKMEGFLRNWSLGELRVARWRFLALREKVVTGEVTEAGLDSLVFMELVRVCGKGR